MMPALLTRISTLLKVSSILPTAAIIEVVSATLTPKVKEKVAYDE
jgi:hypothetical protein